MLHFVQKLRLMLRGCGGHISFGVRTFSARSPGCTPGGCRGIWCCNRERCCRAGGDGLGAQPYGIVAETTADMGERSPPESISCTA